MSLAPWAVSWLERDISPTPVFCPQVFPALGKILQARLQQYMNCEFPDVQAGFRKGRGTQDQIVNIHWIIEKARELQKNIYFCFIDYAKAFDCVEQMNRHRRTPGGHEAGSPPCSPPLLLCFCAGHRPRASRGLGSDRPGFSGKLVCAQRHGQK